MKKLLSICLMIFVFVSLISTITVSATETLPCPVHEEHELSYIEYKICKFASTVYYSQIFETDGEKDNTSLESALKFDISTGETPKQNGPFSNLWAKVRLVYDKLITIGWVLSIILLSVDLMRNITSNQSTPEIFAMFLIKIAVSGIVIINGIDILEWILQMNTFIYNEVSTHFSDFMETSNLCVYNEVIGDCDIFEMIANMIGLIFPYAIIYICRLILKVVAWSRIIGIIVYAIFTPIGIADIWNGTTSSGVRYLRTFAAKLLQGPLIAAIFTVYKLIVSVVTKASVLDGLWSGIILSLVFVTLVIASEQISKEILGG